jgi:hypothetical protein
MQQCRVGGWVDLGMVCSVVVSALQGKGQLHVAGSSSSSSSACRGVPSQLRMHASCLQHSTGHGRGQGRWLAIEAATAAAACAMVAAYCTTAGMQQQQQNQHKVAGGGCSSAAAAAAAAFLQ